MVKVKLLRPLDGQPIGAIAEYPEADAQGLADRGVVSIVASKAEAPIANKMEAAPANKTTTAKRKGK